MTCKYSMTSSACGYGGDCEYTDPSQCPKCRNYLEEEINFENLCDDLDYFPKKPLKRRSRFNRNYNTNDISDLISLKEILMQERVEELLWEIRKRSEEDFA